MATAQDVDAACPICLGQIRHPVISRCCRQRFCESCVRGVRSGEDGRLRCPFCRNENCAFDKVAAPAPWPQPRHRQHRCQAPGCRFAGEDDDFLAHLASSHRRQLLENHHLLFPRPPNHLLPQESAEDQLREHQRQRELRRQQRQQRQQQQQQRQQQQQQRHQEAGNRVQLLADNGKTYCGGLLNGPPCGCCNGICGPLSGCNCVNCMIIDLANYSVTHSNTLVNKFGRVASRSSETGRFYCLGIIDVDEIRDVIEYCGPVDGPNCEACCCLDEQSSGRYASLM